MKKRQAKPIQLPSGSWRIRPIDENGKRKNFTFRSYEEAVVALKKYQIETEEILSGYRSPRIQEKSFSDLCDYWLLYKTSQKRTRKDDESIISCHLRPAFGKLQLQEISISHIDVFKASKSNLAPKTIGNILTLLISMLRLAVEMGWLIKIPIIKKPKVNKVEKNFRYLKSDGEINRFLIAAKSHGEMTYALYFTEIMTGMRQGELAALTFDKINFDTRRIMVDSSFSGLTKSGDTRHVLIVDELFEFLKVWRIKCGSRLVFPNERGNMHCSGARIFGKTLKSTLDNAGFQNVVINGKELKYINFHSLRHTFASHWVMKNACIYKLKDILGHKDISMTMRYAHLAPEAYESDYGRFGG
ncbi:MAG: hypothetical protein CME60_07240 [Halobacteriovoraceae bacterium]|nr:hypothetical protein [Halobacteriovoraceae bacterium]|tara:strand:+ start:84 stop:1157 length:1074 start_codon:yes stop_codon:yes gene_type:complete